MNTIKKIIFVIIAIPTIIGLFTYLFLDKKVTSNIDFPEPSVTLSWGIKFE